MELKLQHFLTQLVERQDQLLNEQQAKQRIAQITHDEYLKLATINGKKVLH